MMIILSIQIPRTTRQYPLPFTSPWRHTTMTVPSVPAHTYLPTRLLSFSFDTCSSVWISRFQVQFLPLRRGLSSFGTDMIRLLLFNIRHENVRHFPLILCLCYVSPIYIVLYSTTRDHSVDVFRRHHQPVHELLALGFQFFS